MKYKSENNGMNPMEKYYSPAVEVITVNYQAVLCQSGQSFGLGKDTYSSGDLENPWDE